jgi:D-beta-D-heptose 7-phosphate kinase/D-beta-D-heptose 1-phosphate adenosyltransferase
VTSLAGTITDFAQRQLVVIGEAMLDVYLHGMVDRVCREAPVPVLSVEWQEESPGGAANVARNIVALGGHAALISAVGRDAVGDRLAELLRQQGVDVGALHRDPDRATLTKQRLVATGQLLLRFDEGTSEAIGAATEDALIADLERLLPNADGVVVSDYAYGVLDERVLGVIGELRRSHDIPLIVDARDLRRYRRLRPTATKPNYAEAMRLLGEPEVRQPRSRSSQVGAVGPRLIQITGSRIVAVTVDQDGAFVFERNAPPYRTYARPSPQARAAGAGDTFVAALALALAGGTPTPMAVELASAASAVVVGRDGTSACSAGELRSALDGASKRLELGELADRIAALRRIGKRIVFTNGCFDILHRGHVTYLNRAKALGDVLVVGVNGDAGVRRLKGPDRPVNSLEDRMGVLEGLSCVDHVVAFDEDTPAGLIERIGPDVFVKGGDYRREELPEASLVESLGGSIRILAYVADRSTSGIISRVREGVAAG